jgi:hypothetical protein
MTSPVFNGPFRCIGVGDLGKTWRTLERGEILRHHHGKVLILRCPACGKVQFVARELKGSDDFPTIMPPVVCGGGACKACAKRFRIIDGKADILDDGPSTDLPEELKRAGVKRPPPVPEV